jgi:predicted dehydrogenase
MSGRFERPLSLDIRHSVQSCIPLGRDITRSARSRRPSGMTIFIEESFMPKTRYAIVGTGWITQIAFLPGLEQTGNSKVTALVTGNMEKARKLADFYGIKTVVTYDQYDDLLKSGAIDAVYIALPNSLHADFAIRAANAGVHAMVEKPLARTEAESMAMIAAFAKANKWLMTAYRLHMHPGTLEVLDLVRSGAIGDPRYFSSCFSFSVGAGNHRLFAEHWGGPLQDIGVYCINAVRQIFADEPTDTIAMRSIGTDERFNEVEEMIAATLHFPKGRIGQFIASFGADDSDSYQIFGSTGQIEVKGGYRFDVPMSYRMSQKGKVTEKNFPVSDHFSAQSAYFSDCIQKNMRPEADGEEGLADMRVMLAIEKAAESGIIQKISSPPRQSRPIPSMGKHFSTVERRLML